MSMATFAELRDSLGIACPEYDPSMNFGAAVAARIDHIEDVVAAALTQLGFTGTTTDRR
jgi:hypothetical protein